MITSSTRSKIKEAKLILESADRSRNLAEILKQWQKEGPLPPEDQLPDIRDMPSVPHDAL